MALIKTCNGNTPQFGTDCWLAENATVVGDVMTGNECSIWFNAVVRGDVNSIRIGNKVNIQDGAVLHCTYQKTKVHLGDNVSIGHNAIVHGCTIEDNPLFLLTSDENGWKEYFKNELLTFAKNNNKIINFINVNYDNSNTYDNYNAVLDLFCLSKCKKIYQDVKYSTFSIVAAIIGNNELTNYSYLLEDYKYCLIHLYHPIININNDKNYNIDYINEVLTACEPIYSNIDIKSF